MCRLAGSMRIIIIAAACLSLFSCEFLKKELPLNPRLLFTVGSEFLESADAVALKGSIDYRDEGRRDSGSFQLVLNHGDSLALFIEGPLKIDVFRLIVAGNATYAWDRDSGQWSTGAFDDDSYLADYGIRGVSGDILGYCIFPQLYLNNGLRFDRDRSILAYDAGEFYVEPSRPRDSFSMTDRRSGLIITYGKRKDYPGGYYPSLVEIMTPDGKRRISLHIEKIKLNPEFSSGLWDRN